MRARDWDAPVRPTLSDLPSSMARKSLSRPSCTSLELTEWQPRIHFFCHQIPRSIIAALQFFVNLTTGNPSSNSSGRAFTEHLIESETWIRGWMNGRREFRAPRLLNSAICSLIANGIRSIKNGGSCESEIPLYRGRRGRNGYDSTFVDGKRGEIESITIVPSYQLHLPRPFHLNGNSQSRTNPLNNSHSVGDRTEGFPTRSVVEGNSSADGGHGLASG